MKCGFVGTEAGKTSVGGQVRTLICRSAGGGHLGPQRLLAGNDG